LRAVFGGSLQAAIVILLTGLCINLVSSALYEHLPFHVGHWLGFAILLALTLFVVRVARTAKESVNPIVAENAAPPRCQVMVLFLAPAPRDKSLVPSWIADAEFAGGIQNPTARKLIGAQSWRMPIESIAYHLAHHPGHLKRVVVLPSSDATGSLGSIRDLDQFRALLEAMLGGVNDRPKIQSVHDLTGAWAEGLDFEDAPKLVDALQLVFQHLRDEGVGVSEILLDITAGPKVTTVVGAAFALGKDQPVQYVSTRDYRVLAFHITYVPGV
jgi:hypothetical protein